MQSYIFLNDLVFNRQEANLTRHSYANVNISGTYEKIPK